MATIAAMSSRGQIVLPIAIRKKLGLGEGTQFLVVTDNENILLKPVKDPSLDEFYSLIEQAQKTAAQLGLRRACQKIRRAVGLRHFQRNAERGI